MSESSEWVAWVGPARTGDVESIEKLSTYFFPFVHAVLLSRLSHRTAGTLVKPVLAHAMSRLGTLSNDGGFGPWMLIAAREKAAEAAKVPGATTDVPGNDPMVNGGHVVLARIRLLSESARERLTMRLLEGISGDEIVEVVGGRSADVRAELERAAATLVQQLGGKSVSFAGDTYLWSLVGTPHAAVIPLENQLTPLRFDPTVDPEATPAPIAPVASPRRAPEGRRPTGEVRAVKAEPTEPSGEQLPVLADDSEESTAANPVPRPSRSTGLRSTGSRPAIKQPTVATDPSNPFGTSVKTIHVSDLPAAADFADLQGTKPEAVHRPELAAQEEFSTAIQPLPGIAPRTREAPQVEPDAPPTRTSGVKPRRTLPPTDPTYAGEAANRSSGSKARLKAFPQPVDHNEEEISTAMRPNVPGGWKSSGVVGQPSPMETVMGLPAVVVARGSVTRSWRPFGIAATLAVVAVGVALLLFDGTKRRSRFGWTLIPVVVAATDLTEGTIVTIEMISTRAVPEAFITSSVIKPDSVSYVVNQKILVPTQAGDPLLWSQFEVARAGERLSKKVMRRARAYDIMTSRAIAVGGWVQPNDRIDIIASLKGHGNERVAITLLQDVPVLSTGKITTSTPNSARKDGDRDYIDVSVLLLPEETELVALAVDQGELQFTLRTEEDHETLTDHRGSNSKTLLQGERVRLLQQKRMKTIQQIRNSPTP